MPSYTVLEGDLLEQTRIVQQVNCQSRSARGLSAAVARRFPWADLYRQRRQPTEPGTVVRHDGGRGVRVYHLAAQWCPGRPGAYAARYSQRHQDTAENRARWFRQCLEALAADDSTDAYDFPHGIGCGLAGGDWSRYERMLREVLAPHKTVRVWRLKAQVRGGGSSRVRAARPRAPPADCVER